MTLGRRAWCDVRVDVVVLVKWVPNATAERRLEAPLFAIADFGVVGDIHKVLPQATEEIRKRKR
jgi:hypothetical protein